MLSVTLILKRTGAVNRMSGLQIPSVNELRVRVICCLICIVLVECFNVNKEIQKGFIIQSGCLFWLVILLWFIWQSVSLTQILLGCHQLWSRTSGWCQLLCGKVLAGHP